MYHVLIRSLGSFYLVGTHANKRVAGSQCRHEQMLIKNSGETAVVITGNQLKALKSKGTVSLW